MDMMKERQIAIIGSGPGGFYTAQALLDQTDKAQRADPASPGIRIDVIDSLPTPYGLIRAGVAPDHQSIKQITGRFDETAKDDRVRFIGHLCVGRDISLDQLLALYDAVVLATGAGKDRPLGLPGENLKGVYGSAAIVGWYNAHPDYADLDPVGEGTAMAVIGNGNVAIDIARIFAKTRDELAQSDIALKAERSLAAMPMHDIHILGRRGPAQAKFTIKEVRELGALSHAIPVVDPADLPSLTEEQALPPGQRKVLATLREFSEIAEADALAADVRVHFHFHARPVEILGNDQGRVRALRLERTRIEAGAVRGTGRFFELPCALVISCIGYQSSPIKGAVFDARSGRFVNDAGLIRPGLYATGWARRGPTGTIGSNKPDGAEIAARILAETSPRDKPQPSGPDHPPTKSGGAALDAYIAAHGLQVVSFEDWLKIDAREKEAARGDHPRLKFARLQDMLDAIEAEDIPQPST
ncbi:MULTISPECIES: FAD-dependent oxidoreductase [unclassified Iodidimonas]|jgi:ferredoxin--NADP+ reductase|uniref:FAD-dependent oxidoreductase n=1 Tax=unclassified Iodidimonas TaxID=2626145 RepID=UPI002482C930|nr:MULTISPECIES: FAD-dependent oxidoreductase [unclassified Iodidimonas]